MNCYHTLGKSIWSFLPRTSATTDWVLSLTKNIFDIHTNSRTFCGRLQTWFDWLRKTPKWVILGAFPGLPFLQKYTNSGNLNSVQNLENRCDVSKFLQTWPSILHAINLKCEHIALQFHNFFNMVTRLKSAIYRSDITLILTLDKVMVLFSPSSKLLTSTCII